MNCSKSAFSMALMAIWCAVVSLSAQAVTINVDNVQQRWPWNNKVDITYTITEDNLATHNAKVVLTTVINGTAYVAYEGGPNENAWSGTHTVTWENPPAGIKADDCKMIAAYYSEPVPAGNDYLIVELSTGVVTYEGVGQPSGLFGSLTGQEIANARYTKTKHYDNKVERLRSKYKTSHMVLRKVPAGTYYTGTGDTATTEWVTDRDFYIQIFPYTNYQYWDVFGMIDISRENNTPHQQNEEARALTWIDIRGDADPLYFPGADTSNPKNVVRWLNGRVAGKLSGKFDLPTKVMREIACRAGTKTKYFWPSNQSNDAGNYALLGNTMADVGSRLPNNWGIFDMVGYNWEFCLDVVNGSRAEGYENDPFAPLLGSAANRVVHGNDRYARPQDLESYRFSDAHPSPANPQYIFRLAYIVPAE